MKTYSSVKDAKKNLTLKSVRAKDINVKQKFSSPWTFTKACKAYLSKLLTVIILNVVTFMI
jgi:hypothetical protein